MTLQISIQYNSSSGDEIPNRDVTYHLISAYLFTTELRHTCRPTSGIFFYVTHICYVSNGRRFTKSALRILLLSTFRVSSINYSLVSRFIQGAPLTQRDREHTVSRNCVKCCVNVRQIVFEKASNRWFNQVIQGHCRCCHLIHHIRFPISLPL